MLHKIRLVLVDDHPMIREGVAAIIGNETDMQVVGQGCDADAALDLVQTQSPDQIFLDINMQGNGLKAAQKIAADFPATKIVIFTSSEDEDHVLEALNLGAKGYILKGIGGLELLRVIRSIQAGEAYVNPALAASLLSANTNKADASDPLNLLTARELDTLELVSTGLSNKEVAGKMCLSEKTIKSYMTHIMQKLNVRNRVEAARMIRVGPR